DWSSDVCSSDLIETPCNLRQQIANGSFQPAKTKVLRIEHAARQIKAIGVTVSCVFFNLRPARITEPEHLGHLIESFAPCVVDGSTDQLIIAEATDEDRHRVSAARDE